MLFLSLFMLIVLTWSMALIRKKQQKFFRTYIYVVTVIYLVGYLYVTLLSRMSSSYIPPAQSAFMSSVWAFIKCGLSKECIGSAVCHGLEAGSGISAILEGMALNVILYIPMGCLLLLIVRKPNVKVIICAGMMISIFTETMQLITGLGWCDIDDIVMNTFGTWLGCWLSKKVFAST